MTENRQRDDDDCQRHPCVCDVLCHTRDTCLRPLFCIPLVYNVEVVTYEYDLVDKYFYSFHLIIFEEILVNFKNFYIL